MGFIFPFHSRFSRSREANPQSQPEEEEEVEAGLGLGQQEQQQGQGREEEEEGLQEEEAVQKGREQQLGVLAGDLDLLIILILILRRGGEEAREAQGQDAQGRLVLEQEEGQEEGKEAAAEERHPQHQDVAADARPAGAQQVHVGQGPQGEAGRLLQQGQGRRRQGRRQGAAGGGAGELPSSNRDN